MGPKIPKHIAIIMDGNGRWAQQLDKKRTDGHREGTLRVDEIVSECAELGVGYLTLYTFSTENWQRPLTEVTTLMGILMEQLKVQTKKLLDNRIELRALGSIERLPFLVQRELKKVIALTQVENPRMVLSLCLSYGGRQEILDAAYKFAQSADRNELPTEEKFKEFLYDPKLPDPDLLIRTGGDARISNFLLWQLAYAEMYLTKTLWPDFNKEKLLEAIEEFSRRQRRFGKTGEQIEEMETSP